MRGGRRGKSEIREPGAKGDQTKDFVAAFVATFVENCLIRYRLRQRLRRRFATEPVATLPKSESSKSSKVVSRGDGCDFGLWTLDYALRVLSLELGGGAS